MSILKLGKITLSTQRNRADFLMALSLDTSSGFTYPYAVYTVEELTSYFGEFRQKKLCEKLLERNIPLLVLPVLSRVSWANKASLRLCNGNVVIDDSGNNISSLIFCHPRLEEENISPWVDNKSLENVVSNKTSDNSNSFCLKLDFTNAIVDGIDSYFIIPCLDEDNEERLVLFTFINERPIEEDYYDYREYKETTSIEEIISLIEEKATTYNYRTLRASSLLSQIIDSYSDFPYIGTGNIQEEYSQYLEKLEEFLDYLSKIECYLDEWSQILDKIERILSVSEPVDGIINYVYDEYGNLPEEVSASPANGVTVNQRLQTLINQYSKILIIEYDSYVKYYRTNHMTGLKNTYLKKYNDRVLSTYTNKSALFEVFARVKGPKGNQIHINIERYEFYDNSYIVRIISEEREELYYINTDLSVDINSLGREFQRIQAIDQRSQLVSLNVFDYILSDGTKIDKRFYDFGLEDNEDFVTYENFEDKGYGELKIVNLLPEGYDSIDLYLDNAVEELSTFYSRKNNIKTFKNYEYYPDFFLEDLYIYSDLWKNVSDSELSDYLNDIYDFCVSRFSQSLVNFSKDFLERGDKQFPQLNTSYRESRILKFYNTLILEGEEICSFYPYILNFLDNDYLAIISDNIIGKVTPKEDEFFAGNAEYLKKARKKLIKAHLNFIDCDNINYFYTNIREPYLDPSFILRFCISKLSREIMINERLLIACPQSKLEYQLNLIVSRVVNLVTLITSLTYIYELNNHNLSIEFTMNLPKIVNQTYVFNITINY